MPENSNGLQFIPETRKKIDIKVPGENRLLSVGVAVFLVTALLVLGLYWYKENLNKKIAQIDSDLLKLEQQRNKKSEENILTLSKQLSLISTLLVDHVSWSVALSKIESLLQPQIQFESFSATLFDNKLDFKALALNYTTIAKQIASLNSDDSIKDVTLSNVTAQTSGKLEFNINLNFDKDKFLKEDLK